MALIIDFLASLSALQTSILIFVCYLLFYTMYDKVLKTLVPNNLIRILTFQDGIDKTLVEFNKAISLSGLTVLPFAFFPIYNRHVQADLLWSAMVQLWIHFVYSTIKYYGTKNIPVISSFCDMKNNWTKKVAIIIGLVGQLVLSLGFFSFIGLKMLAVFGISLGMLHFYTMEIDYKYIFRVRPFAYIAFPLGILGILYGSGMM